MVSVAAVAAYTIDKNMKKANDLQEKAQQTAVQQAQTQATAVENEAQNQAAQRVKNNKTANAAAVLGNQQPGGASGGTMLTGPQGIDPTSLSLARNTLLGM